MKLTELLSKITPLPYRVSGGSIVTDGICIAVIEDDGGYEAPSEQREANSAYLSHAANVLPELVEALRELDAATRSAARLRVIACGKKLEDAENRETEAYLGAQSALARANEVKT